jgi:hypothetical protein
MVKGVNVQTKKGCYKVVDIFNIKIIFLEDYNMEKLESNNINNEEKNIDIDDILKSATQAKSQGYNKKHKQQQG